MKSSLLLTLGFAAGCLLLIAQCADESAWKSRVIYQILTDRFESGSASPCSDLSSYCGGTWAGIEKQLDYIQGLRASLVRQCLHQQSRRHGVRCNMDQPDGLQYSKRLSRLLDARPLWLQPQFRQQVRSSSADSGLPLQEHVRYARRRREPRRPSRHVRPPS